MIASFTGHRLYREQNAKLKEAIVRLYNDGYRTFMSGMAEGFDLAAAECVLELKQSYGDIKLICVVPFEGHRTTIQSSQRLRDDAICLAADEVITLEQNYHHGVYNLRNDYLVDKADAIVCYYSGLKRSGTGYTVTKAIKKMIRVINIYADGCQIEFFV